MVGWVTSFTSLKFSHCCRADFREALNVDGPFIDSPAAGEGMGQGLREEAQVFSSSANSFKVI